MKLKLVKTSLESNAFRKLGIIHNKGLKLNI